MMWVFALSAIQCLAFGQGHSDHTLLLQAELEKVKVKGDDSKPEHEGLKEPICQQLAGKDGTCERLAPQPLDVLASAPEQKAPRVELQQQVEQPPAGTGKSTGTVILGYILDALIVVLVIDGLRRWRQGKVEQASESSSWDALMQAALAGDDARCEALLGKETNIDGADLWGCTLLHAAGKGGSVSVVRQLLERGAKADELDCCKETPLHIAARAGHTAVCKLLLAHGAAIDAVNAQGWTPLVVADDAGQEAVCRFLVDEGASAGDLKDAMPALPESLLADGKIQGVLQTEEEAEEEAAEFKRRVEEEYWQGEMACGQ